MTGLARLVNQKDNSYDLILVITDHLTNIVYYKPIKITIDIARLVEIIIYVIVRHHNLSK